jgi:hypothetical protein
MICKLDTIIYYIIISYLEGNKMKITKISPITGIEHSKDIPVNPEDYFAWKQDYGSIDDCMPYLTTNDREFILSGIVEGEWENSAKFMEINY